MAVVRVFLLDMLFYALVQQLQSTSMHVSSRREPTAGRCCFQFWASAYLESNSSSRDRDDVATPADHLRLVPTELTNHAESTY